MKNEKTFDAVATVLLVIGGLNWGFIGLFGWDFVSSIFGEMSNLTRIIFVAVGLAALYRVGQWLRKSK